MRRHHNSDADVVGATLLEGYEKLPEKTSELEEVSGQEPEKQSQVLFKASSHDNIPESSYSPFNSEHTASGPRRIQVPS